MQPKLKESPREWTRFTLVLLTLFSGIGLLLWWRGILPSPGLWIWLACLGSAGVLLLARPRWRRAVYRTGMTISFRIGMVMGTLLLILFYLILLTPLALLLRVMGKDLLEIKPRKNLSTYWRPSSKPTPLERMF